MEQLRAKVWDKLASIPGMLEGESVFTSGPAFWVDGKQVAHFVAADALALRLTKGIIRELRVALKAEPRVELKSPASDWLIVHLEHERDVEFVMSLARRAATAHVPEGTRALKEPPTGVDLARRRRFH